MEMNTRLQVEHPVTEMIARQDLVEWQLRIADGQPLPLLQDRLVMRGHAIEVRIYAENPDNHFLPSTGTLRVLRLPKAAEFEIGSGPDPTPVRVDSGVREGDVITPYYDPMIAKLIVWGDDRTAALARLRQALESFVALGLQTNRALLWRLVNSPEFAAGNLDIGLVERNLNQLLTPDRPISFPLLALATAALLERERAKTTPQTTDQFSPWTQTSGWRLNAEFVRTLFWRTDYHSVAAKLTYSRKGYLLELNGHSVSVSVFEQKDNAFVLLTDTGKIVGRVYQQDDIFEVVADGEQVRFYWVDPVGAASHAEHVEADLSAPMPGKIVAVLVKNGETVSKGAALITMEAMKMEHTIVALADGVVDEVLFNVGDQVTEGTQLLRFSPHNS
jgi:3-methylcrotonyl-CoA carboxylase alpha subunit